MPGSVARGTEVPLAVRAFRGVMLAADPAFIGSDYLQVSDKWRPDRTRVLAKRRGEGEYQTIEDATGIDRMIRVLGGGNRYLYVVAHFGTDPDAVWVSTNDGAFAAVTNGAFATGVGERYGFTRLGNTVYVGNGVDPLKAIVLGDAAVDLVPLALATDAGEGVVPVADTSAGMLPGTYSYRWATYDETARNWTGVGPVHTTTISGAGWYRLLFTAPAAGLAGGELWHLFLAGVDQEIEGAHDQTAGGLAAAATYTAMAVTADGVVVPSPSTVQRRGRILVTHRGAIVGAGDPDEPRRAWATSVIPQGLEQDLFNQGVFFPAQAYVDLPADITGLAVASLTSTQRSPTSPLALFTETSTHFALGDFIDDPTFQLIDVSTEVGCASDRTIVNTPVGVVFLGQDGVYLLPPSLREPVNVGWPIEDAIRAIPAAARGLTWAMFHKGFYQLACAQPGGLTNVLQWSLDLRQGLGDVPSWWGPDRRPAYTAATRSRREPAEDDRGWAALGGSGEVVLLEQAGSYLDQGEPIVSRFKTARLIESPARHPAPLQPKNAKRVRAIAKVGSSTQLDILVRADGALGDTRHPIQAIAMMPLPGSGDAIWNVSEWNIAEWASSRETKGTVLLPAPEVRGLGFEITVTHTQAVAITLRDLELRVQPDAREED